MAAPVILVEARPRGAADGAAVLTRLAGGGALLPYHYAGEHWRAGIAGLPKATASLEFDGEQLGGGGVAQALELRWAPATRAALAEVSALYWADAPIVVRIGPEGAMPAIAAQGLVLETAVEGGVLRIALADGAADLKRALLTDRFGGTGGIEGPVEFDGLIKSRAWGRCYNVPGRIIDKANNIWVFGDPRRRWQAFDQVRDKGVAAAPAKLTRLAWQGSAEATFTALQGASAPAGGGVVCPDIACVKWWTEPAGDLHADIRGEIEGGYVETAPEIAARLAAVRSTIPVEAGAVAAATAWRPAVCGWRVDSESVTAADAVSEILGDVSLSWVLTDGAIAFRRWEWTASTRVARSHRVTRRSTVKPVASRKLGYRRNWSPMSRGDLAAIVFVQDVVMEDGSPAGQAIADAGKTADWDKVADPTGAKPADHADVTGDNTAKDTAAVHGRPAEQVVSDADLQGRNIFDMASLESTRDALMLARTTLDGKPIGTVVTDFKTEFVTEKTATVERFSLLGAKSGDGQSWVLDQTTVTVGPADGSSGPVQSLGQRFQGITTTLGSHTGSINDLRTVLVDASGAVTAKAVLGLNVDGRVAGVVATNTGTLSRMEMLFDAYNFLTPSGTSIFSYTPISAGGDGKVYLPDVVVRSIAVSAVGTDQIESQSIRKSYGVEMAASANLPLNNGARTRFLAVVIAKSRADSVIRIDCLMRPRPGDSYSCQFVIGRTSGGAETVMDTVWYSVIADQIAGVRTVRIPFYYGRSFSGLPVGSHTIWVDVVADAGGNGGAYMEAGSNLDVEERKR